MELASIQTRNRENFDLSYDSNYGDTEKELEPQPAARPPLMKQENQHLISKLDKEINDTLNSFEKERTKQRKEIENMKQELKQIKEYKTFSKQDSYPQTSLHLSALPNELYNKTKLALQDRPPLHIEQDLRVTPNSFFQNANLDSKLKKKKKKIKLFRLEIEKLTIDLELSRKTFLNEKSVLINETEKLKSKIKTLESEYYRSRETMPALQFQLDTLKEHLAEAQRRAENAEAQVLELHRDLKTKEEAHLKEIFDMEEEMKLIKHKGKQFEDISNSGSALKTLLPLSDEIDGPIIHNILNEIIRSDSHYTELRPELISLKEKVNLVQQIIKNLLDEKIFVEEKYHKLLEKDNDIDSNNFEIPKMYQDNKILLSQIDSLHQHYQEKVDLLEQERKQAREEIRQLRAQLDSFQSPLSFSRFNSQISNLEKKINALGARKNSVLPSKINPLLKPTPKDLHNRKKSKSKLSKKKAINKSMYS